MALKAGYKGIKKALADLLTGAKFIMKIGDGISLSSDGEISVSNGAFVGFDQDGKLVVLTGNGLHSDASDNLELFVDDNFDFDEDGKLTLVSGGGSFTKDALISEAIGSSTTGEVTLLHDISDYDMLEIITQSTADGRSMCGIISVGTFKTVYPYSTSNSDPNYNIQGYGGEYTRLTYGQADNKLNIQQLSSVDIKKINGIKF